MKNHHPLTALAALMLALALTLTGCGAELPDLGMIGGDDGPTSIYLDGSAATSGEDNAEVPGIQPAQPDEAPPEGTSSGEALPYEDETVLDEDGTYNSAEDVSLYLYTYGCLPDNYITKSEARDLGWTGGSVEQVAPGCAIGGDVFGNREKVLPDGKYHECDIDTIGERSRGAKRIVYSDDGRIYYTEDHYETFTLLYGEE